MSTKNPIVFFDIKIGSESVGRVRFELFAHRCPKTSENFRQFCTGEFKPEGISVGYKGCILHRIVPGFIIQGGDFMNKDGSGSVSIYGRTFPDENFSFKHSSKGLLSMANRGKDTNGSQFFVTLAPCPSLDGKHTVFGRVVAGLKVIEQIAAVPVDGDKPRLDIIVEQCGEY